MKFRMTMKDPDALSYALSDAKSDFKLDNDQVNDLDEFAHKFMSYGEYITVEFDTDKGTATVLEN